MFISLLFTFIAFLTNPASPPQAPTPLAGVQVSGPMQVDRVQLVLDERDAAGRIWWDVPTTNATGTLTMHYVRFDHTVEAAEVIETFDGLGLRAARRDEMVMYRQSPNGSGLGLIIGLGSFSSVEGSGDTDLVPGFLDGVDVLSSLYSQWPPGTIFLAVKVRIAPTRVALARPFRMGKEKSRVSQGGKRRGTRVGAFCAPSIERRLTKRR